LGYRDVRDDVTVNLLHQPTLKRWQEFTCLNSLREVEPNVTLILDDHHLDEEPRATPATLFDAQDNEEQGEGPA
jgi:hypothetical protein